MEVVIDSNLVYSALIKDGRIARLILNPNPLGSLALEIMRRGFKYQFFPYLNSSICDACLNAHNTAVLSSRNWFVRSRTKTWTKADTFTFNPLHQTYKPPTPF